MQWHILVEKIMTIKTNVKCRALFLLSLADNYAGDMLLRHSGDDSTFAQKSSERELSIFFQLACRYYVLFPWFHFQET